MNEEKRVGEDGVSLTRRLFLTRAGRIAAGLTAAAVVGPPVMMATAGKARASGSASPPCSSVSTSSLSGTDSNTVSTFSASLSDPDTDSDSDSCDDSLSL